MYMLTRDSGEFCNTFNGIIESGSSCLEKSWVMDIRTHNHTQLRAALAVLAGLGIIVSKDTHNTHTDSHEI